MKTSASLIRLGSAAAAVAITVAAHAYDGRASERSEPSPEPTATASETPYTGPVETSEATPMNTPSPSSSSSAPTGMGGSEPVIEPSGCNVGGGSIGLVSMSEAPARVRVTVEWVGSSGVKRSVTPLSIPAGSEKFSIPAPVGMSLASCRVVDTEVVA